MNATERFQKEHGQNWAIIANGPELTAAMTTVNAGIIDDILRLSPETIASPQGNVILAQLQGRLQHEQALVNLSVLQPNISDDLPPATYPNPGDELEAAADEQDSATGADLTPFTKWQEQSQPKPKRKYTKRKKK